jgi:hypothetical protein
MAESIILNTPTPPTPTNGNVASLVPSNTLTNLSKSASPKTFGDQLPKIAAVTVLAAASKTKLAKLTKEKAVLIQEGIQLDIQYQVTLLKLEQAKTPKKQIQNGQTVEIPAELTEEEYQTALIVEKGGILPNGQQIKGNYPTAKENLQKRKDENQKAINDIIKDPFKTQKDKLKKLKDKLKKREKKTKEEKRAARKAKKKAILQGAKRAKSLVPVVTLFLVDKIANIIAQNDRIGQLVDNTNATIEEANLSSDPIKLQNAKLARDNAIRIITDNENKIRKINDDIKRISTYITIFSTIVNIISAIPIPTSVPPGIGIPVNLIMRFVKILDKANRIILSLSAYLPTILLSLDKAIQILIDYKSQLLNINEIIDRAAVSTDVYDLETGTSSTDSFLTEPTGTDGFEPYKGFRFAIKEEENPKFVVRGYKRRYAVAINDANIEILKSEYSFTLDPNDLIEQLKLLIDQNNLSSKSGRGVNNLSNQNITQQNQNSSQRNQNTQQPSFQLPSSSDIAAAQSAVMRQPPQEKIIKAGPFNQKIPLSVIEKAKYIGIAAASPEPSSKLGAIKILAEDKKWQAEYKKYQKSTGDKILKLPS